MNARAQTLIDLAKKCQENLTTSKTQILERITMILQIIQDNGHTYLRKDVDQASINIIAPYLKFAKEKLNLTFRWDESSYPSTL